MGSEDMRPGQLFDTIRSYYLARFSERVREVEGNVKALVEPALLTSDGGYALEGELRLPYRADLVLLEGSAAKDSIMIDTEGMISFEAFSFDWTNGVRIAVAPFRWNLCICGLSQGMNPPDWAPLRTWFLKWFEEDPSEPTGPYWCLHYMSDPEPTEAGFGLEIDFGSAPVTALEEFFDAVGSAGFKRVRLGNR